MIKNRKVDKYDLKAQTLHTEFIEKDSSMVISVPNFLAWRCQRCQLDGERCKQMLQPEDLIWSGRNEEGKVSVEDPLE